MASETFAWYIPLIGISLAVLIIIGIISGAVLLGLWLSDALFGPKDSPRK